VRGRVGPGKALSMARTGRGGEARGRPAVAGRAGEGSEGGWELREWLPKSGVGQWGRVGKQRVDGCECRVGPQDSGKAEKVAPVSRRKETGLPSMMAVTPGSVGVLPSGRGVPGPFSLQRPALDWLERGSGGEAWTVLPDRQRGNPLPSGPTACIWGTALVDSTAPVSLARPHLNCGPGGAQDFPGLREPGVGGPCPRACAGIGNLALSPPLAVGSLSFLSVIVNLEGHI
jgi:hypothetical protein